jgi:hypothetical protein
MLKRKINKVFKTWKSTPDHNPIIIKGCRQCGKTFSVLNFARENYKHVVYLNFFENPLYARAFDGNLQIDTLIMNISVLISDAKFVPGSTCLIFDEIQECPRARMALKFFKLDGRFDVMCTGSLLGISGYGAREVSVPVGYETIIEMRPLDFEEFLWGNGISEQVINSLADSLSRREPIAEVIHGRMNELLLQYIVVGGMPAVVNRFINTHNLNEVLHMQRDIITGYRDDMVKYATGIEKSKIRECFDSIPMQLSKENKKFQYSLIQKRGSASIFSGSLQWLEDAGIIQRCYNLNVTELPLEGNSNTSTFKVYMADIGLFISMLEDGTQADVIQGSLLSYKGAIYENLVADFLGKAGKKLYYFRKDSGLEVDFATRISNECVLIECKATTGDAKSARTILRHPEKYHVSHVIKLGRYNIGYSNGMLTLPLYLGFLIPRITL